MTEGSAVIVTEAVDESLGDKEVEKVMLSEPLKLAKALTEQVAVTLAEEESVAEGVTVLETLATAV